MSCLLLLLLLLLLMILLLFMMMLLLLTLLMMAVCTTAAAAADVRRCFDDAAQFTVHNNRKGKSHQTWHDSTGVVMRCNSLQNRMITVRSKHHRSLHDKRATNNIRVEVTQDI